LTQTVILISSLLDNGHHCFDFSLQIAVGVYLFLPMYAKAYDLKGDLNIGIYPIMG